MSVRYADLTDEQRQIVETSDTDVLVLAGAGTGKTTTALWAARRELERRDFESSRPTARVLMLTFSRTATSRVLQRAGGLLQDRDRVEIQTFHGFAYRIIRDFGRFFGLGASPPELKSSAEINLFGKTQNDLTYNDLLPLALKILDSPAVKALTATRWSLLCCDEFQDTTDEQWMLLELLASNSRLLLLGDVNQRIYDFLPGVGPHRIAVAESRPGIRTLPLPRASHRDTTQVLPAAAEAILRRDFGHEAITAAIEAGRLEIRAPVDIEHGPEVIANELRHLRKTVGGSTGVYVRENSFVRSLCTELAERNIVHTPVGLGEAAAHAIRAQALIVGACFGQASWADVCKELGVYLAANSRGKPPTLAYMLARGQVESTGLRQRLDQLKRSIESYHHDLESASDVAIQAWSGLGLAPGARTWKRSAQVLVPLVERAGRGGTDVGNLIRELRRLANGNLTASVEDETSSLIQVMTMHQTKGRESDSTIVWARSDDYHGPGAEWVDAGPRLLYVALTRARKKVVILIPEDVHALWSPLLGLVTRNDDPEELRF